MDGTSGTIGFALGGYHYAYEGARQLQKTLDSWKPLQVWHNGGV